MKPPDEVFGAARWAHIQHLAATGYIGSLADLAKNMTAPFWWKSPERGALRGGTMCFVNTGLRILGVSAAHVHDEIIALKGQGHVHSQVGGHTFEPSERVIDVNRKLDLVTYDFSEVATNAARANVNTPTSWPPPVEDGNTVLACGWPSELWTPGKASHDFEFLHFIALLQKNSVDQLGVVTFTSSSVPWGDRGLPPGTNLGGMSGGPVYRVYETPLSRLELVGIVYEYQPTYELVLARPLSLIAADGRVIG